jgi:uncharacterized membrane protein
VDIDKKRGDKGGVVMIIMVVVAVILLLLHWKGPNAVWGGATLGVVVGIIVSLVAGDWSPLPAIFMAGTIVGAIFEWVWKLGKSKKD